MSYRREIGVKIFFLFVRLESWLRFECDIFLFVRLGWLGLRGLIRIRAMIRLGLGFGIGFGFGFFLRLTPQSLRLFFITCSVYATDFLEKIFNHQLYLYNGGLIYGKSAVVSHERGQGTYSSTQSYVYVSIFLHISPYFSIFTQISLFFLHKLSHTYSTLIYLHISCRFDTSE